MEQVPEICSATQELHEEGTIIPNETELEWKLRHKPRFDSHRKSHFSWRMCPVRECVCGAMEIECTYVALGITLKESI